MGVGVWVVLKEWAEKAGRQNIQSTGLVKYWTWGAVEGGIKEEVTGYCTCASPRMLRVTDTQALVTFESPTFRTPFRHYESQFPYYHRPSGRTQPSLPREEPK